MRHLAPVAFVLLAAASLSALDRAARRHLAACALTLAGLGAAIVGGVPVALCGCVCAAAGFVAMAQTARAAGA